MHLKYTVLVLLAVSFTASAEPLPFEDGKYVADLRNCQISDQNLVERFGDGASSLVRYIDGKKLRNSYEMDCEVANVRRRGDRVSFDALCEAEGNREQIRGSYVFVTTQAFKLAGTLYRRCEIAATNEVLDDGIDAPTSELLELWRDADGRCRGGLGNDPETYGACASRDEYGRMLAARNWCYGKYDEAGYQMQWHICGSDSIRE